MKGRFEPLFNDRGRSEGAVLVCLPMRQASLVALGLAGILLGSCVVHRADAPTLSTRTTAQGGQPRTATEGPTPKALPPLAGHEAAGRGDRGRPAGAPQEHPEQSRPLFAQRIHGPGRISAGRAVRNRLQPRRERRETFRGRKAPLALYRAPGCRLAQRRHLHPHPKLPPSRHQPSRISHRYSRTPGLDDLRSSPRTSPGPVEQSSPRSTRRSPIAATSGRPEFARTCIPNDAYGKPSCTISALGVDSYV